MATTSTVTSTFAGEAEKGYITAALYGSKSLSSGVFTVKDKINKTRVIKTLNISGTVLKARTDAFTPTGDITVGERSLTPKDLEVNIQLIKSDFEDDWNMPEMGASAHKVLAKSLTDAFVQELVKITAKALENQLWSGDDGTDEIHGILTRMKADVAIPAAQKITGTTVTAANVIVELGKIVAGITEDMRSTENLVIAVAPNIKHAYVDALGGFGASGLGANGVNGMGSMWYKEGQPLTFQGIELIDLPGITTDHGVAVISDSLWFGTDLESDYSEVKLLDQSDVTGDDWVNCIMKFTGDTNYGFSTDVVYYGITA